MKFRFALFALLPTLLFSAGCHGQANSNPTVYSCPIVTGSLYAVLNPTNQSTGLSYVDSKPAAGVYCYYEQSTIGAQISLASNVVGPVTLSGSNSANLTWNAPLTGPTPTGYITSRAPAVATTLLAPSVVNGTVAEVKPALPVPAPAESAYAVLRPLRLKGTVR